MLVRKASWMFLFIRTISALQSTWADQPEVKCSLGLIRGQKTTIEGLNVDEFLGLPYARPPTGQLRFALPVPYGSVGEFNATKYCARCPQPSIGPEISPNQSEDCLCLNVYRKSGATEGNNKPVIIIIHGGAFSIGSSSDPFFYGSPLAGLGDVIVVSLNYRLGVLGFADMKEVAPGNLGLFDQRLGLEWIQNHIRAFGGNPDQVTLMGVSAGSMSISAQIMTPLNRLGRKLFHAVVMDAGALATGVVTSSDVSLNRMKNIAEKLGCNANLTELLSCLRNADVNELVALSVDREGYSPIFTFGPTIDGTLLPGEITRYVHDHVDDFVKVRTLIGYAKDEGSLFAGYQFDFDPSHFPELADEDEFLDWCGKLASGYLYPIDLKNESTRKIVSEEYYQRYVSRFLDASAFLADGSFICPVNNFVKSYSKVNPNVYLYRFERKFHGKYLGIDPDLVGAFHISPFLHMTGSLLGLSRSNSSVVAAEDREFFIDAIRMISNFAGQSDKPPIFRGVKWPQFGQSRNLIIFDDKPYLTSSVPSDDRCKRVFPFFET